MSGVDYLHSESITRTVHDDGEAAMTNAVLRERIEDRNSRTDISNILGEPKDRNTTYKTSDLVKLGKSDSVAVFTDLSYEGEGCDWDFSGTYWLSNDGKVFMTEDGIDEEVTDLESLAGEFGTVYSVYYGGKTAPYNGSWKGTTEVRHITQTEAAGRLSGLPKDTDFNSLSIEEIYAYAEGKAAEKKLKIKNI